MKNYIIFLMLLSSSVAFCQGTKTATKNAVSQEVAADAIILADSSKEKEITVDGKDVILSGNENRITFKGKIGKIIISGKNNDITIETVNHITVTGSGNFVSWEKSENAKGKPVIQDNGGYNNIERRSDNVIDRSDN